MIERLEDALSRLIDGGVASVFRLRLEPAEIGRRLEHALLNSRRASAGGVMGANLYEVALHPDDHAAFAGWESALARELEIWLADVAYRHGIFTMSPPTVTFSPAGGLPRRSVRVTASFGAESTIATAASPPQGRLIRLVGDSEILPLRAVETTVGRAPDNDVVIDAAEVSRRHAHVRLKVSSLEVHDLGSRNGTWVNGRRIARDHARSGDEIAFGTLRYRLDLW